MAQFSVKIMRLTGSVLGENQQVSYYIRMSPGLTGPWQVSGRNDLAYHERVALDVDYARNCNVATDIKVIFATAMAVLKRTGR